MSMRMLIDARHPEETRVAVAKGNRIEEFDFESAEHKQLKGNIYLAKVTRVEPSLQAAFIDYGGNRHGFLAFSEIHPDYYQIPKADRDALLAEEAEHAAEEERLRAAELGDDDDDESEDTGDDAGDPEGEAEGDEANEVGTGSARSPVDESAADELRRSARTLRRRYKIQDVIQRRQVLLVQVVKEERGNKGAALTTYLSLAGRYCVLMPNTSHGGGISRKISNGADRKRLKSIISDLKLPSTMGLIVRTAGLSRTKVEIKRDFDYLARLWDEIRERTLSSSAPALIYRDSDLIKRAIRDLYHREIDEVIVEGDEGYKAARGFMKLLMPSHVRRVKQYVDPMPVFQRYGVEDQLTAMYQPVVQLKSGGYLVINPTEALVSIDINSGRSTREHNIEQTAFATNLEAAHEIARQLRLRDMAGLVVIDFIDMEQSSHVRKVEKAMKEALKNDRARIQVGRISGFGLMEMSRQRLRTGVLEASTKACPHCEGTGLMRTASLGGPQRASDHRGRGGARPRRQDPASRRRARRRSMCSTRSAPSWPRSRSATASPVEVVIDEAFEGARMTVESSGPRPQPRNARVAPIVEEEEEYLPEDEEEEVEEAEETDEAEAARGCAARTKATAASAAAVAAAVAAAAAAAMARPKRRGRGASRNRRRDPGSRAAGRGREAERPSEADDGQAAPRPPWRPRPPCPRRGPQPKPQPKRHRARKLADGRLADRRGAATRRSRAGGREAQGPPPPARAQGGRGSGRGQGRTGSGEPSKLPPLPGSRSGSRRASRAPKKARQAPRRARRSRRRRPSKPAPAPQAAQPEAEQ